MVLSGGLIEVWWLRYVRCLHTGEVCMKNLPVHFMTDVKWRSVQCDCEWTQLRIIQFDEIRQFDRFQWKTRLNYIELAKFMFRGMRPRSLYRLYSVVRRYMRSSYRMGLIWVGGRRHRVVQCFAWNHQKIYMGKCLKSECAYYLSYQY